MKEASLRQKSNTDRKHGRKGKKAKEKNTGLAAKKRSRQQMSSEGAVLQAHTPPDSLLDQSVEDNKQSCKIWKGEKKN